MGNEFDRILHWIEPSNSSTQLFIFLSEFKVDAMVEHRSQRNVSFESIKVINQMFYFIKEQNDRTKSGDWLAHRHIWPILAFHRLECHPIFGTIKRNATINQNLTANQVLMRVSLVLACQRPLVGDSFYWAGYNSMYGWMCCLRSKNMMRFNARCHTTRTV